MSEKHLYIFVADGSHPKFAEGADALKAYQNMLKIAGISPNNDGFTAWRLADDAEPIPVGGR